MSLTVKACGSTAGVSTTGVAAGAGVAGTVKGLVACANTVGAAAVAAVASARASRRRGGRRVIFTSGRGRGRPGRGGASMPQLPDVRVERSEGRRVGKEGV